MGILIDWILFGLAMKNSTKKLLQAEFINHQWIIKTTWLDEKKILSIDRDWLDEIVI